MPAENPTPDPLGAPLIAAPESVAPRPRKRLPAQALTMTVVLGVSVAALWAMRQYGMRAGMVFASTAPEMPGNDASKARNYDRIMADLARIQQPLDIAMGEFQKSPFMLDTHPTQAQATGTPEVAGTSDAERLARLREQRRQDLEARVHNFVLHSVVGGRVPVARIDDRIVKVGDLFDKDFKVEAIDGRSVSLSADGMGFTLTMEIDRNADPKRSPVQIGRPGNPRR